MKKGRKKASPAPGFRRLLFFDIVRIVCIAAIVYAHFKFGNFTVFNSLFYASGYLPLNIYSAGLQGWAVFGLIFVSGAVLEYNYKQIDGYRDYARFIFKRFIRIYPAFWLSLLFGLLLSVACASSPAGEILKNNLFFIIFEYTGFFVILGQGPGFINEMGWFIAAIMSLYLLYPWLSGLIRKYGLIAVIAFMVVTFSLRSVFFTCSEVLPDLLWRWFPLCNAFEFCLGIYIVRMSFYPVNVNDYPVIHEIAEFCYYLFLFHVIIFGVITSPVGYGPVIISFLEQQFTQFPLLLQDFFRYCTVEIMVLSVSAVAMIIDRKIQRCIRQNPRVREFLASA